MKNKPLLLLSLSLLLQAAPAAPKRMIRIHGKVSDVRGLGLENAEITMSQAGTTTKVETDEKGNYVANVKPEILKLNVVRDGFCPATEEITLDKFHSERNIVLLDCSDCPEMDIDYEPTHIETDGSAPAPVASRPFVYKYKTEDLVGQIFNQAVAKVYFGTKTEEQNTITYHGLDCPGYDKNPVLVFNGGNLSAAKLVVSREGRVVRGEGNVLFIDKRGTSRGSSIEIDLSHTGGAEVKIGP